MDNAQKPPVLMAHLRWADMAKLASELRNAIPLLRGCNRGCVMSVGAMHDVADALDNHAAEAYAECGRLDRENLGLDEAGYEAHKAALARLTA